MHIESYPQLIPLVILIPAIGAFINFFVGSRISEKISGLIGITAAVLSFIVSFLILIYVNDPATHAAIVNPAFVDGWIRIESIGLDIPWQFRVDSLTATMLMVVTGVGSLIHIYSVGYMHGDPKFGRFFAYLNMFLMFMLILVTANNFLMMFVGWEGVGLCSYLLIGFWWTKKAPEGWKNSNAARKAMIVNRIGDFGILMAVFLIFWTFGTLNYYGPGESANVAYELYHAGYINEEQAKKGEVDANPELMTAEDIAAAGISHDEETTEGESAAESEDHSEGEAAASAEGEDHSEGEAAAEGEEHGEEEGHGAHVADRAELDNSQLGFRELGVFGQINRLVELEPGETLADVYVTDMLGNQKLDENGQPIPQGRDIYLGPFVLDISTVLFLIVIFMLLGVTGKSAQIPLFVWLPDAMAGPTPVSALIHAATMVTAGVFLLVRSSVMLDNATEARFIIAVVGGITALTAGYIAMGQWDVKRVLAYSTVSQLGFMVAAVGIGAYVAAIFHLATHAVFKALLFLGSGSIIHGVEHGHHHVHEHGHGHNDHHDDHHEEHFDPQDMRNMGGLRRRMPVTFVTYLVGTFALAGLPFFAGFWSKDEILLDAWHVGFSEGRFDGFMVFGLLLVAAGFTAFYMWRQIQMVFYGEARSEAAAEAPESSGWMLVPLMVLAIATFFVGFINVPYDIWPFSAVYKPYEFKHFLEPSIPSVTGLESLSFNPLIALLATGVAFGAIFLAHSIYAGKRAVRDNRDPLDFQPSTQQVWRFANARMYWDETYYRLFEGPFNRLAAFFADVLDWRFLHDYFHDSVIKRGYDAVARILSKPVDIGLIDGAVNGVGWLVRQLSSRMRTVQTGYVRTYAVVLLLGVVAVVVVMLLPLIQNGQ